MIRRFLLLGILALSVTAMGGGFKKIVQLYDSSSPQSVYLSVTDSGDSAQVSLLHTLTAVDSFDYKDTFSYQYDTSVHQTIKWTSAVQIMIITPTVDTASLYACSVSFAADTLGIAFDASGTKPVLDSLIDSLVAKLNAVAGLTDSVDFQDSATYIKAVSLFGQRKFTARWKIEKGITGGTGTIDTASHASLVTVAMVVDSMVAAINADAGLDSFMTAANSGDTGYTITSDDAGVLFYATTLNHADTGGTLVASQANVTSKSTTTDTIALPPLMSNGFVTNAMYGRLIVEANPVTLGAQVGNSDSIYIHLYTVFAGDQWQLLLDDSSASLPCTSWVAYGPDTTGGGVDPDTLFHEGFYLTYTVTDTATDTSGTVYYPLKVNFELKDR